MSLEMHQWLLDRLTEYGLANTVHIVGFQSGTLNDIAELQPGTRRSHYGTPGFIGADMRDWRSTEYIGLVRGTCLRTIWA
jgi:hypothetical protein